MIYNVFIHKIVNDIEFGMKFDAVRKILSGKFISYNPGAGIPEFSDDFPADYYEDDGLFCYYDRDGHLEAMGFFSPSRPMLEGVDILSLPVGRAITLLRRLDPTLDVDEERAISYRLSLGIRLPDADDGDDAPVESFLVGRPGYYDLPD